MRNIAVFFAFVVSAISCSNNTTVTLSSSNDSLVINEDSIESFNTFIEKFHNDSVFAQTRIEKETIGASTDDYEYDTLGNPQNTDRIWTKVQMMSELKMINGLLSDSKYKVKYEHKEDKMLENVFLPESGFNLFLYFTVKENKWFLTEYYYNNL